MTGMIHRDQDSGHKYMIGFIVILVMICCTSQVDSQA